MVPIAWHPRQVVWEGLPTAAMPRREANGKSKDFCDEMEPGSGPPRRNGCILGSGLLGCLIICGHPSRSNDNPSLYEEEIS